MPKLKSGSSKTFRTHFQPVLITSRAILKGCSPNESEIPENKTKNGQTEIRTLNSGPAWCKPYKLTNIQLILVLLAIHKNWNTCRSILGVVTSEYRQGFSLCRYGADINHHIGFPRVSRGQLLKVTEFIPLTMTTVVPSSILLGQLLSLYVIKKPIW